MDVSKWIYGFLWSGRGESRERGLPPKERDIYISASDQTNTSTRLGFGPPPLFFYEMVLFFSTTNFTLLSQKNKKKTKKKAKELVDV